MIDFSKRNTETELMDDLAVNVTVLGRVFKDINRSNRLLGGNRITIKAVSRLIQEHPKNEYNILDMGCGDGQILREIVIWGRKRDLKLKCTGIDLNENALTLARKASMDFPEIEFKCQDILGNKSKDLSCDILLCTLTVHHFKNLEIPVFLKRFVQTAHIGIVINDLQRSAVAYYLFKGFSTIFIQTKIAKNDGAISILSGFKKAELVHFSKALPTVSHRIRWKWAFRYVWVMQKRRLS